MRHYEIVFIVHPDQSEQVPAMIERYKASVTARGGNIHRVEDWGRGAGTDVGRVDPQADRAVPPQDVEQCRVCTDVRRSYRNLSDHWRPSRAESAVGAAIFEISHRHRGRPARTCAALDGGRVPLDLERIPTDVVATAVGTEAGHAQPQAWADA